MQNSTLKIFVGGFGPFIEEKDIRKHFRSYGAITDIDIKKNAQKNHNKGFAFVICADQATVDRILDSDHILDGRQITCALAHGGNNKAEDHQRMMKTRVYVKNLTPSVKDSDLQLYFVKFGAVKKAFIIMDPHTKKSKLFGYVEFENETGKNLTLNQKVHTILGCRIMCEPYKPKALMHSAPTQKSSSTSKKSTACSDSHSQIPIPAQSRKLCHKKPPKKSQGFSNFAKNTQNKNLPSQIKPSCNSEKSLFHKEEELPVNYPISHPTSPMARVWFHPQPQPVTQDDWYAQTPINHTTGQYVYVDHPKNSYPMTSQPQFLQNSCPNAYPNYDYYEYVYPTYSAPTTSPYSGYKVQQYYPGSEPDSSHDQWLYDYDNSMPIFEDGTMATQCYYENSLF